MHYLRRRQPSSTSIASSCSSHGDEHFSKDHAVDAAALRSRQPSTCLSERSCGGMSLDETRDLWKCMLELQELYGCYNSTRIDLALNAGDDGVNLMPNPFIIDTLNDSLIDLPEEGWEKLDRCLRAHDDALSATSGQKSKRKFWSRQ